MSRSSPHGDRRWSRALTLIVVIWAWAALAMPAHAAVDEVFTNTATPVPCMAQTKDITFCTASPRSTVQTFDGVPIDVNVALPPRAHGGPGGPFPLVILLPGYGGSKSGLAGMYGWLDDGYAVLSMTPRGFGESCGTAAAREADSGGCANGYVHLADTRYEVRDAQELAGLLVDEGLVLPQQIGAAGGSYGGAIAMSLGALRDRKMLPDGSLVPWTSPAGTALRIAAAAPLITWSDLMYSVMPNGRTLDYLADAPEAGPTGVRKQSLESGLYGIVLSHYYLPEGGDPDADIFNWHALMAAGEPYDDAARNPLPAIADMRDELTKHHSPYYVDHSRPPAPMLISNGWTDDLFPADEAIRFYNRTRTEHSATPIGLFLFDVGHERGQGKAADRALMSERRRDWFRYYLTGSGTPPHTGIEALTETCPATAPSAGPYTADTLADLAPGEVTLQFAPSRIVFGWGGDQSIADAFDPVSGGGACVTTVGDDQPGTASYRMSPAPPGGFTLMGSPTVIADFAGASDTSQIAARLLDVAPDGGQTLVARGVWRPAAGSIAVRQVFQLHPNGWRFEEGHVAKLELLPKDPPYAQASASQTDITVQNLELRLPVREGPGTYGGLVQAPAAKILGPDQQLARDFQVPPYARPKAATTITASLVPSFARCSAPNATHGPPLAYGACEPPGMSSQYLTIGTRDVNGTDAAFVGTAKLAVLTGDPVTAADEADVQLSVQITDVRSKQAMNDYTGELRTRLSTRITDRLGPAPDEPATVQDSLFYVTVPCAATSDPGVGATCGVATTLDAVVPGAIPEGRRSVWQLAQIDVLDGGSDGIAATTPNTLFARQGIFVP
jgi:hypothetical protein